MTIESTGMSSHSVVVQPQPANTAVEQAAATERAGESEVLVREEAAVQNVNPAAPVTEDALSEIAQHLNDKLQGAQRAISFVVDRDTDETVILVKDSDTDEVIRQIPNEEAVKLSEYLDGMLGLIFDKKA